MHGVCGNALDPTNRPSVRALRDVGAEAMRFVLTDDPAVWDYYTGLALAGIQPVPLLTFASFRTADYEAECASFARRMDPARPPLLIIGNEPNAHEEPGILVSSDIAPPERFAAFYNACRRGLEGVWGVGSVPIAGPGLLGRGDDGWLDATIPLLERLPNLLNVHYPQGEDVLQAWARYGITLMVGEWCWSGRGVLAGDFIAWFATLRRWCAHTFWFCWGYRTDMAVVSPKTGRKLVAFWNLKAAFRAGGA